MILLGYGTLLLASPAGDVLDPDRHGLFVADTRHLSTWVCTVDGAPPVLLKSVSGAHQREAVLVPAGPRGVDPPYTLFRTQTVHRDGLTETVRVVNNLDRRLELVLGYQLDADFADQFELRTDRRYEKHGAERGTTVDNGLLRLWYRRAAYTRQTLIRANPAPVGGTPHWTLALPPHGEATVRIGVSTGSAPVAPAPAVERLTASISTMDIPAELRLAVNRGMADLATLLIPGPLGEPVVAAGAPWFLTLFGRDSLLTSLFLGPVGPDLSAATLRALAALQGRVADPARAEQPGKIIHETRAGELSRFGQVPYRRYYGTVDATPLFLMLLAECGDDALTAELRPAARAAVDWMRHFGGLDDVGYLVYATDAPDAVGGGLVHQCWKDSAPGVCHPDGTPAAGLIAVCEAQGYAYAALRGVAGLARRVWHEPGYAGLLDEYADRLRERFLADFWLPGEDFVALALYADTSGAETGAANPAGLRRIDTLGSNAGHVLWTGLLDDERGRRVGQRLTAGDFDSGWGIRTLAAGQPAYHPVSYHNGSVWPHDTAIAVAGLARYGLLDEAWRIASGLLAAAEQDDHRLPEVLCGYGRAEYPVPVPYPHSCSPQAWAAAAPMLIARVLGTRTQAG